MQTQVATELARNHQLHLFPVREDKTPATAHGYKDASNDEAIVRAMFDKGGKRVGLYPGPSGLVVVDIDVKNGATGEEEWHEIVGHLLEPAPPEVITPSGGRHLYFRKPMGTTFNNTKLSGSIDIRGDGGYVLVPSPGSGYEWEIGYPDWCKKCDLSHHLLNTAPVFPDFLMQALEHSREREAEPASDTDRIPSGARQDTLFRAGMSMRAKGVPLEGIEAALREMNDKRCDPPVSNYRIKDLMRGVRDQHMDHPFEAPAVRKRHNTETMAPLDWEETWAKPTEKVAWLPGLEGLAIQGRVTNLYGPAGVGKSEIMLQRAVEAAKLDVRILWLDREMTWEDMRERLIDMGYDWKDLGNLIYYQNPVLPDLDTEIGGEDLLALAQKHGINLVVLDSLSKFVKGDEQDSNTATDFFKYSMLRLKDGGVASVTIDHAGKDITRGARGTSAKKDNTDLYMEITRIQGVGTRLTTGKQRHSWVKPSYIYRRFTDPIRYTIDTICVWCKAPAVTQKGEHYLCEDHQYT